MVMPSGTIAVMVLCLITLSDALPQRFELMPKCQVYLGDTMENCIEPRRTVECDANDKFRTFDGTCNNLRFTTRGATHTPLRRFIRADYIDGDTPRGFPCHTKKIIFASSLDNDQNPSTINRWSTTYPTPHQISIAVFKITRKSVHNTRGLSALFMTFGQFLDHDITMTPHEECEKESCSDLQEDFKYPCFPLKFEHDKARCTGFARSKAVCQESHTYMQPRNQVNIITSYIDASMVYGSDDTLAMKLRTIDGSGKLRISEDGILPVDSNPPKKCTTKGGCSLVGDERGDENIALHSMHTLWVREHNRISTNLQYLNPHWSGEQIYNNARKIVGAMIQHIVFSEYLPNIVYMPQYQGYNDFVDSSIINGFATAAFRYGHSLIPNAFSQLNINFNKQSDDIPLQKAFFNTEHIHRNGIESTIIGLCSNQSNTVNTEFSDAVNRKLFVPLGEDGYDDLSARNIQRGRDHGIHTYGEWRSRCRLSPIKSFDDLKGILQEGAADSFEQLYQDPNDIDLFAAGIAEKHVPGLIVGETFQCIFQRQFLGLREGDRFFYLNKGVFTSHQQQTLKKVTLANVICNNLKGMVSIQRNVFKAFFAGEKRTACQFIDDLDISLWKDTSHK